MTMVAGINAAPQARAHRPRGLVATSLLRTGMYCMGWDIGIHLRFGRLQSTRLRSRQPAVGQLVLPRRRRPGLLAARPGAGPSLARTAGCAGASRPGADPSVRHSVRAREHLRGAGGDARRGVRPPSPVGLGRALRRPRRVVGADQHRRGGDRGSPGHRRRRSSTRRWSTASRPTEPSPRQSTSARTPSTSARCPGWASTHR